MSVFKSRKDYDMIAVFCMQKIFPVFDFVLNKIMMVRNINEIA